MPDTQKIADHLRQLGLLEMASSPMARALTEGERRWLIEGLRRRLPLSVLRHHDRLLQRGRPSMVPVRRGVCSGCHLHLPSGHLHRLRVERDLEVCDNCGAFIYLEKEEREREVPSRRTAPKRPRPGPARSAG